MPVRKKTTRSATAGQPQIKKQLEWQKTVLTRAGVLTMLSDGRMGMIGINGKEYPFPAYQVLQEHIRRKKKLLQEKWKQGFTRLLVVPFAMSLDVLIEKYGQALVRHLNEGKLYATRFRSTDPAEPMKLDVARPVWVWGDYKEADKNGKLIYLHREFGIEHRGVNKETHLSLFSGSDHAGWQLLFMEDLPNIPGKYTVKTKGGRTQLASGSSAKEYMDMLASKTEYTGESGMTPEDWISYALTHLEDNDEVIDDYMGTGRIAYQLGGYFAESNGVPCIYWGRSHKRANFSKDVTSSPHKYLGARTVVRF